MKDYDNWYARRRRLELLGYALTWLSVAIMVTFFVWVALVLLTSFAR